MPSLRRLAPLVLALTSACVSGTDGIESTWEGCASDLDCKDGRVCRDGACQDPEGSGGNGPDTDVARVLFRLSLDPAAGEPVYVQDHSQERADAWFTLVRRTGDAEFPVPHLPPCSACFCGACASCGGLCGPARPRVKLLEPGAALDVRWDGTTFPVDSTCPGDGSCYNILPALEGATFYAKFCWSLSATGVGEDQELLAPIYCESRLFQYTRDTATLVAYQITSGA